MWLLPGVVVMAWGRVLANGASARGKPGVYLAATSLGLVVNVIANVVLIPRYGIVGAAVATTLVYALVTAVLVWEYSGAASGGRLVTVGSLIVGTGHQKDDREGRSEPEGRL